MYIKNLTLKNYRNYEDESFNFSSGVNILVGNNAQGKTNSAEAIFYLCTGYSPRVTKDKQVIKYGSQSAKIKGVCESRFGDIEVEIEFKQTKKNILVNGVPLKKIGELMGNINSVFFNPSDLKLIQESPEDRRRFLDISLSQMDRQYFYSLQTYKKILEQRNNLLKSEDEEAVLKTLPLWDKELAVLAVEIIKKRKEYLLKLTPHFKKAHFDIAGGDEIEIALETKHLEEYTVEEVLSAYEKRREKDLILGYTTIGPHRDDLKIKLNGEDVRVFASQGQQRSVAISLKLAELEVFKERFLEYPILILDDALSELDSSRRNRLIDRLSGFQTIITVTDIPSELEGKEGLNIIKINNGKIEK